MSFIRFEMKKETRPRNSVVHIEKRLVGAIMNLGNSQRGVQSCLLKSL
jgi:hypothetical protein